MTEIKFDPNNYRIHSDKNKRIINKSLKELGAGRSVLVDNEDVLIAGNGVYKEAQDLGIPVRVIETDGTELVVVKRTDLSTDDERRKQLALVDNHASDTSEFDVELVLEDFNDDMLDDWEINLDNFHITSSDIDDIFSEELNERPAKQKELICPHCGKNIYEEESSNI